MIDKIRNRIIHLTKMVERGDNQLTAMILAEQLLEAITYLLDNTKEDEQLVLLGKYEQVVIDLRKKMIS